LIIRGAMCALVITPMVGCQEAPRSEKWIGTYSYANDSTELPLYLDIKIEEARISGRAFDSSMEEATVSGTVNGERYELLLHPLKHGTSSEQDIHYRARRANDSLAGEWEHVAGVKGPWTATITDRAARPALELHTPLCEPRLSLRSGWLTVAKTPDTALLTDASHSALRTPCGAARRERRAAGDTHG